jgi:hypothetical protein
MGGGHFDKGRPTGHTDRSKLFLAWYSLASDD